jgi:hypothetical protein
VSLLHLLLPPPLLLLLLLQLLLLLLLLLLLVASSFWVRKQQGWPLLPPYMLQLWSAQLQVLRFAAVQCCH